MSEAQVDTVLATHLEKGSLASEVSSDETILVATRAFVPIGFTMKKLKEI